MNRSFARCALLCDSQLHTADAYAADFARSRTIFSGLTLTSVASDRSEDASSGAWRRTCWHKLEASVRRDENAKIAVYGNGKLGFVEIEQKAEGGRDGLCEASQALVHIGCKFERPSGWCHAAFSQDKQLIVKQLAETGQSGADRRRGDNAAMARDRFKRS